MALAIDAVTEETWRDATTPANKTFSHTVSGANRVLYVGVASYGSAVSGVTYNGDALSEVWNTSRASAYYSSGWILVAPDTGTHDVVVTYTGTASAWQDQGISAISFTGANQTTPNGTAVTANNYSTSASVTVSTGVGEIVVDAARAGNGLTVGSDQTRRLTSPQDKSGASTQAGADGGVMSWSLTIQNWAIGAVSIKPAAAATGNPWYYYAQQ